MAFGNFKEDMVSNPDLPRLSNVRILHFSYSYKAGSGFEISEAFKKLSKNIIFEKHHIPDE